MRCTRGDDGAMSAEFISILPIVMFVAAIGWQLLVVFGAGTATATAARNGSRSLSTAEDPHAVVERSLPGWLRDDHEVRVIPIPGTERVRVEVEVKVPILFPGITADAFQVTRSAELPRVGDR